MLMGTRRRNLQILQAKRGINTEMLWIWYFTNLVSPRFVTGGSWKKSPVTIICIPPKGFWLFRITRASLSMKVKTCPSTIETSSMMRNLVLSHRCLVSGLLNKRCAVLWTSSLWLCAPAQWKMVVPPMWTAAIPVLAVTAVTSLGRHWIRRRSKNDFPVPAAPEKKTVKSSDD